MEILEQRKRNENEQFHKIKFWPNALIILSRIGAIAFFVHKFDIHHASNSVSDSDLLYIKVRNLLRCMLRII